MAVNPSTKTSILLILFAAMSCLVLTSSSGSRLFAAEDTALVLRIGGDLIPPINSIGNTDNWQGLIANHYQLLPDSVGLRAANLAERLAKRCEDYVVAYNAADSAELAEVMDDISLYWVTLKELHRQHYTQDAVVLLGLAYSELFPLVIEKPLLSP